jgi:hypothetical protein
MLIIVGSRWVKFEYRWCSTMADINNVNADTEYEGRDENWMDIDRMINEGLGGGTVSPHNGLIEETTTDTMEEEKA